MKKFFLLIIWLCLLVVLLSYSGLARAAGDVEVIHHEGDLIVASGQELVIRDEILQINGSLIAQPGSKIIIENATLVIELRYKGENQIKAIRASVEVHNSTIRSTEEIVTGEFGELAGAQLVFSLSDTTFEFENSTLYCRLITEFASKGYIDSSIASYIYWGADTNVQLSDSTIGSFVFMLGRTHSEALTFVGLRKGTSIDFSTRTNDGGVLELRNSSVELGWHFDLGIACQKDITVENSEIELFWIKFPPTEQRIKITSLQNGYFSRFSLQEHVEGKDLPFNVTLVDSQVLGCFKLEMLSTVAEITDSFVIVHPYDSADLIIQDSTVVTFFNYGSKKVEFINTELKSSIQMLFKEELLQSPMEVDGKVIGAGGTFHFIFRDSRVDVDHIIVACGDGSIEGEIEIMSPQSLDEVHWFKGTIERQYPIIAMDKGNNPMPGVPMQLFDSDNRSAWSGITNEKGEVFPVITFDKNNYTQEWTLVATDAGSSKHLGLLTSTPVIIYPTAKDLVVQLVGPNWIVIFVTAVAIVIVTVIILFMLRRKTKVRV